MHGSRGSWLIQISIPRAVHFCTIQSPQYDNVLDSSEVISVIIIILS